MAEPCPLSYDFLYDAYCVQRMHILAIARLARRRNGDVIAALKAFGLHRPNSYMTQEWMEEHYVNQRLSCDDIAALLGITEASVRRYLREYGIPIRYRSRGSARVKPLNDHDWLYDQYVTQRKSACAIAHELRVCESSVMRALARHDIPRRFKAAEKRYRHAYRRIFSDRKRQLIMARDQHHCRMPGCTATEDLQLHHIIPLQNGGTNAMDNGITLCRPCHQRTFGCEESFALLFWSILATRRKEPLAQSLRLHGAA